MRPCLLLSVCVVVLLASCSKDPAAQPTQTSPPAREGRVQIGDLSLYARDIGQGRPIVVLHGGPDFDHAYLVPDLDRLADTYRLIYYDQRGRGRSADRVRAEDVTLASDVSDVDAVFRHFQLNRPTLLGHSWGAVLALEYALRHSSRVSGLILMNPAPASAADVVTLRRFYAARLGADMDEQRAIMASTAYQKGDPEVVAARYRIHFKPALYRPEDYERLMAGMKAAFIRQGPEGILKARAVEDRLMRETWEIPSYDLMPRLADLRMPALVIYGEHDFIPREVASHIAASIPNAHLVTFANCGHFAYLECPGDVRRAIADFFRATP